MRVLIQRVAEASVTIHGSIHSRIDRGLLLLVGFESDDSVEDIGWITGKVSRLRIFPDAEGVMNLSLLDTNGNCLVVSQFTLHASTKKGNRPSYIRAARPEHAVPLYEEFLRQMSRELSKPILSGVFGADMQVSLVNDGPVTIWMDSKCRE